MVLGGQGGVGQGGVNCGEAVTPPPAPDPAPPSAPAVATWVRPWRFRIRCWFRFWAIVKLGCGGLGAIIKIRNSLFGARRRLISRGSKYGFDFFAIWSHWACPGLSGAAAAAWAASGSAAGLPVGDKGPGGGAGRGGAWGRRGGGGG